MTRALAKTGVLLSVLVVSAGASLAGACTEDAGPVKATLAEIVAQQEDYDGRVVETRGVVRQFGSAEGATRLHYVVEDDRANRVAIAPNDLAGRYTGQEVVVVGPFRFSEQRGRRMTIERIGLP